MNQDAQPAPHGELAPAITVGDPDLVIVRDANASVGSPHAQHELTAAFAPPDASVVIVPPQASAGVTPSRPVDAAAALDVDAPGAGGIMRAMRANRGR